MFSVYTELAEHFCSPPLLSPPSSQHLSYCGVCDSWLFSPSLPLLSRGVKDYAREGLRTLVVAKKELTEEEYLEWAAEYKPARYIYMYNYTPGGRKYGLRNE